MSKKHSIASRKRWADIPKEERSRRMSALAIKKASSMTKEARHAHAIMMVKSKLKK